MSEWHVLFAGLIGVILSQVVTWWRDRVKKKAEDRHKLQWLQAEILDNLEHAGNHYLAGGKAKVKLLTEAWETVKGDTLNLNPTLSRSLRNAYAEVWRLNCIVDYDLHIPQGHGTLNTSLEVKANEVKTALADAHAKLAEHLGEKNVSSQS